MESATVRRIRARDLGASGTIAASAHLIAAIRTRLETDNIDLRPWFTYNVHMNVLRFAWDERKNRANKRKHGVTFEEAQTSFLDENAKIYTDPDHSEDEGHFILLGMSFRLRTLVVCHCYREKESLIRIISARKADKNEQRDYWS